MNDRTSRRSFVALAAGTLGSLAAGLGRVFGQDATARTGRQFDAAAPDPVSGDLFTTTYTYDSHGRLVSISEPARSVVMAFRYAPGSCV